MEGFFRGEDNDAQSESQEANDTHAMIITPHIQQSQRQRMAFESANIALDQGFIERRFDRLGQPQSSALLIGRGDAPAQEIHRPLDGLLIALTRDLKSPDRVWRRQRSSRRANRLLTALALPLLAVLAPPGVSEPWIAPSQSVPGRQMGRLTHDRLPDRLVCVPDGMAASCLELGALTSHSAVILITLYPA